MLLDTVTKVIQTVHAYQVQSVWNASGIWNNKNWGVIGCKVREYGLYSLSMYTSNKYSTTVFADIFIGDQAHENLYTQRIRTVITVDYSHPQKFIPSKL